MENDLISRQDAIKAINKALDRETFLYCFVRKIAIDAVRALPSAQPDPLQIAKDIATIIENEQDMRAILAQSEPQRTFVELVVDYPDPELCTYKEYKGKPYYSIKYIENGKTHVGYGTYNPKVLSRYLSEYFISSAQPDPCEGCKHRGEWENEVEYGYPSPCTCCERRAEDHYER